MKWLYLILFACLPASAGQSRALPPAPKAVILIYADDLGYGDLGCNGAKAIPTPHIDKLAGEGMRNTSAYCTSATCTPSRYSLLTGEYPWRRKGTGILPGDAALIVPPSSVRPSLPSIMQAAGYKTGIVGKWHLGLGKTKADWNRTLDYGPNVVGFDESFILAATADRVPCVYIKNGKVVNLDPADPIAVSYKKNFPGEPVAWENPEKLRWKHSNRQHADSIVDGIGRIGFMKGGKKALWKDQDMADTLTEQAVDFIKRNKDHKLFLYFATNDIHAPRDPHKRFIGKSGCGIRGDVIVQFDHCVGLLMKALKENGLDRDTLVILSSDNGPVVEEGYHDGSTKNLNGHKPAGPFRGGKYSLLEGGTRMPFITWWPGKIEPGTETNAVVSQMDLGSSLAALTRQKLPEGAFPDAQNVMTALLDKTAEGRNEIIINGMGQQLALRQGNLKYYPPGTYPGSPAYKNKGALFDLEQDPEERIDILEENRGAAEKMADRLKQLRGGAPAPLLSH